MLNPNHRTLLYEALKPPHGFELEQAIGTTFTLDLESLISIPLAFLRYGISEAEDIGLIAALAQYSDRITLFAQAGAIRAHVRSDLYALLERGIIPVHLSTGIFHPKVWIIEYTNGRERKYRFLCFTRNLTSDNSWDLSVQLEGETSVGETGFDAQKNKALEDFLDDLIALGQARISPSRKSDMQDLRSRIASVSWTLPEGIDEVAFHYFDGTHTDFPVIQSRQAVLISPFMSAHVLSQIQNYVRGEVALISRPTALDSLGPSSGVGECSSYVFADQVVNFGESNLSGLHAKAYFFQEFRRPSRAQVFIGSANMTRGGFGRNIEFLVELRGRNNIIGPSQVFQSLSPLLEAYSPNPAPEPDEKEQKRFELQNILRTLSSRDFYSQVVTGDPYSMEIWCEQGTQELVNSYTQKGVEISWNLFTGEGRKEQAFPSGDADRVVMRDLKLTEITPFIQINISIDHNNEKLEEQSLVISHLYEDPQGRQNFILTNNIKDVHSFFTLIQLLLEPSHVRLSEIAQQSSAEWGQGLEGNSYDGIFESLMMALPQGTDSFRIINKMMVELKNHQSEDFQLPEEFEQLWESVWEVNRRFGAMRE